MDSLHCNSPKHTLGVLWQKVINSPSSYSSWLIPFVETERISVSTLASDLDISTELVVQLARSHPKLCLLSADRNSIIPIDERDALQEKLAALLTSGLHSKADFVTQHDIWLKSLDALLADQDDEILDVDSYMCTKIYESQITSDILTKVKQSLNEIQ